MSTFASFLFIFDRFLGIRLESFYTFAINYFMTHGLRTPGEEIAFTARRKIKSQPQIYRYGRSIFCLPHRPKISGFFDLCLHWVSVVRVMTNTGFSELLVYFFLLLDTCNLKRVWATSFLFLMTKQLSIGTCCKYTTWSICIGLM